MTFAVRPEPAGTAGIDVQDVSVSFEQVTVVERATLRVPPGHITAVVGEPGCGKSTLLRVAAGLLAPERGAVRICGLDQRENSRSARAVLGWTAQGAPTWPDLTVTEALTFVATLQGIPRRRARARIHEVVHLLGLRDCTATRAADLSSAHRHRLILAQALLHNPSVLILDGLLDDADEAVRLELGDHLRRSSASGVTVLLSARSTSAVADCAQRVLTMSAGRLTAAHDLAAGPRPRRWRIASTDAQRLRQVLDLVGFTVDDAGEPATGGADTAQAPRTDTQAAVFGPIRGALDVEIDDEEEAVALLRRLISSGVAVLSFAPLPDVTAETPWSRPVSQPPPGQAHGPAAGRDEPWGRP